MMPELPTHDFKWFGKSKILQFTPKRIAKLVKKNKKHLQFMDFPINVLDTLNVMKFKEWAMESILKASKKGIYSLLEECITED